MLPPKDEVYWTFSSAAQAVATFIGFALAGYGLVYTMMEKVAQEDETLREIQERLKAQYHGRLRNGDVLIFL